MTVQFRPATPADVAALLDVLGAEPSDEQLGLAGGNASRARAFRTLMNAQLTGPRGLARTTVAYDEHGAVVGMVQCGGEVGDAITASLVLGVLRVFGFGVVAFLRRNRVRGKVHIVAPPDAYHIAEVHVSAARRNAGIGGALLVEAERAARRAGATAMSLTTTTSNPARRLYERHGFTVTETRTDPDYLALTGVAGRILMVKPLGDAPP